MRGRHSTPGAEGTTLTFEVYLKRHTLDEVTAYLNVGTFSDDCRRADDAQARATAADERKALRRLASYLRRCADAIDAGTAGLLLPSPEPPESNP